MMDDIINHQGHPFPMNPVSTETRPSRVQRVRHEIKRRELEVVSVEAVTPGFRRITLRGDALADFTSLSFDDHVKLFFDTGAEGEPARRDYTPRSYSNAGRTLTLEFALHGEGPASGWAAQAAPGQRLVVAGPRGSFVVPVDHDWHLLAGDETALPAIARRLEELPAGTRALVFLQVKEADRRPLGSAAALDLHWARSPEDLLQAVKALALPAGEGYAWCAGEAAMVRELRRILVDDKGLGRHAIRASAYWKRGANAHHEDIED
jgi:NADPH-dependent ferric siderophore reductase